jgi:hypothetical protein
MDAADDQRSIVIADDRTPMMDDADGCPVARRHGEIGCRGAGYVLQDQRYAKSSEQKRFEECSHNPTL